MLQIPCWTRRTHQVLVAATLLLTAACAAYVEPATETTVWVRVGPPPPRYEVVTMAPGPDYIWIVGYYEWNSVEYVWIPGRWERRPSPGARWVRDRWHHEDRGWRRVPGHWEEPGRGRGRDRRPERGH